MEDWSCEQGYLLEQDLQALHYRIVQMQETNRYLELALEEVQRKIKELKEFCEID